jgi:hypothetical protein
MTPLRRLPPVGMNRVAVWPPGSASGAFIMKGKAPTGYAKRVVSLPVGVVRRESALPIALLRRPVSRKVVLALHLRGTQISLAWPLMEMAVPFV